MKKIYIDNSITRQYSITGVAKFIFTLNKAILLNKISTEIFGWTYPMFLFRYKYILYIIWLNTVFYIKSFFTKSSIYIYPGFIRPYLLHKKHQYYPVIHDLTAYRDNEMSLHGKFISKLALSIAIRKATTIITVSKTIKNELIEKFNISPEKIKIIYNSIGSQFANFKENKEILNKYEIETHNYILSVATLNKRKNIPELIKAFEQISEKYPDLKLVLVGGMGNEQREKLTKHSNVIFTGYIKDEELPTLYSNALLYMYPSLYEGFGIPLIEAQYCGCPVLCSDIPVFREIGANSVEYCKPEKSGIVQGLNNLINNKEKLDELTILGFNNVKRFSIDNIAQQVKEVING